MGKPRENLPGKGREKEGGKAGAYGLCAWIPGEEMNPKNILQRWFGGHVRENEQDLYREVQELYRKVFESYEGRMVLTHMLTELGYFSLADNETEVVLQNYAKKLLQNCGILTRMNVYDLDLINAMMAIPLEKKKTEGSLRR